MARPFNPTGIYITSGLASCAYHCRYCQLVHLKPSTFGMERFAAQVERFADYREKHGLTEFDVSFWNGYSYDFSLADFEKELALHRRVGEWELKILLLGGLPHMEDAVLEQWFAERKKIGSEFATATYTGYRETHDYWNNKKGNFDFLLNAQKIAARAGLANDQRILLTRSGLEQMPQLLDTLDALELELRGRNAYPFFYSGLARRYEEERVTMAMLDRQPERVRAVYRDDKRHWKSERAWIEHARTAEGKYEAGPVTLVLSDSNIGQIESMSCEAILDDLTRRTRAAYDALPGRSELAEKYADPTNEKIYMFLWEMECLWMDRHLKEHPVVFERELTHFGR